jgi:hypothetical protein
MLDSDIAKAEVACFHIGDHSLLLAPWPLITERIVHKATAQCADQGWASPDKRYEAAPAAACCTPVATIFAAYAWRWFLI